MTVQFSDISHFNKNVGRKLKKIFAAAKIASNVLLIFLCGKIRPALFEKLKKND